MASRLGRVFQLARPSVRVAARNVGATKRCMSTTEHGAHSQGSDRLWQIGSALIFGPALIYVLSPPSQKAAHDTAHSHKGSKGTDGSTPFPVKDDEDAPKDAQAAEEKPSEQAPMTDDEGTSISGEEAKESMKQAFNADAPADAQAEEEKQGKYTSGAPGQTAEAESKPDQNEKPSRSAHTGSLQSDEDSGPTNMGDARKTAKSGEAPKEASED